MARWKKEGIFLTPLWKFKCGGCEDPAARFIEMGYALLNFPIYIERRNEYNSYALDRKYYCNLCGWQLNFGIALQKEHWEAIKEYDEEKGRGITGHESRGKVKWQKQLK